MLKTAYVGTMRQARRAARGTGLLGFMDGRLDDDRIRWARSLLAVYDIDDMARLDLPWWTFEAIGVVDRFLAARPGARVFEWGSGASTIWLGRRAGSVVSVEHDPSWTPVVAARIAGMPHVAVHLVPPDEPAVADVRYRSAKLGWKGRTFKAYVDIIDRDDSLFDLIVIDGRARPACLVAAIPHLAAGGMILLDNSHRRAYRRAIAQSGLAFTRTRGLTACLPYPDETTILMAPG